MTTAQNVDALMANIQANQGLLTDETNQFAEGYAAFNQQILNGITQLQQAIENLVNSDEYKLLLRAPDELIEVTTQLQQKSQELLTLQQQYAQLNQNAQTLQAHLTAAQQQLNDATNRVAQVEQDARTHIAQLTADHAAQLQQSKNATDAEKAALQQQFAQEINTVRSNLEGQLQEARAAEEAAKAAVQAANAQLSQSNASQQNYIAKINELNDFLSAQIGRVRELKPSNANMAPMTGALQNLYNSLSAVISGITEAGRKRPRLESQSTYTAPPATVPMEVEQRQGQKRRAEDAQSTTDSAGRTRSGITYQPTTGGRRVPGRRTTLRFVRHRPRRHGVTRRHRRRRRRRRVTRRRRAAHRRHRPFRGGYTYKKNADLDKRSSEVDEDDQLTPIPTTHLRRGDM